MKTAEEYIPKVCNFNQTITVDFNQFYSKEFIIKSIKQAQKDAYNQALEDAAENIDQDTKIYADFGVAESIRIEIRKLKKQ